MEMQQRSVVERLWLSDQWRPASESGLTLPTFQLSTTPLPPSSSDYRHFNSTTPSSPLHESTIPSSPSRTYTVALTPTQLVSRPTTLRWRSLVPPSPFFLHDAPPAPHPVDDPCSSLASSLPSIAPHAGPSFRLRYSHTRGHFFHRPSPSPSLCPTLPRWSRPTPTTAELS